MFDDYLFSLYARTWMIDHKIFFFFVNCYCRWIIIVIIYIQMYKGLTTTSIEIPGLSTSMNVCKESTSMGVCEQSMSTSNIMSSPVTLLYVKSFGHKSLKPDRDFLVDKRPCLVDAIIEWYNFCFRFFILSRMKEVSDTSCWKKKQTMLLDIRISVRIYTLVSCIERRCNSMSL